MQKFSWNQFKGKNIFPYSLFEHVRQPAVKKKLFHVFNFSLNNWHSPNILQYIHSSWRMAKRHKRERGKDSINDFWRNAKLPFAFCFLFTAFMARQLYLFTFEFSKCLKREVKAKNLPSPHIWNLIAIKNGLSVVNLLQTFAHLIFFYNIPSSHWTKNSFAFFGYELVK